MGGGFVGLEVAENLLHRGMQVAVVEALPQVMAPLDPEMVAPVHRALRAALQQRQTMHARVLELK